MSSMLDQVATNLSADQSLTESSIASSRLPGRLARSWPPCHRAALESAISWGVIPSAVCWQGLPAGCLLSGVLLACAGVMWIEALTRRASPEG